MIHIDDTIQVMLTYLLVRFLQSHHAQEPKTVSPDFIGIVLRVIEYTPKRV